MKIALACGGPSSEHDVSISSCKAILKAIDNNKYDVSVFYISKDLTSCFFKPDGELLIPEVGVDYIPLMEGIEKYLKPVDKVLLAGIHGEFVEDGRLQCILDYYDISYTGSGMAASALAMDKYRTSLLVSQLAGLKIPEMRTINIHDKHISSTIQYPIIFKPNSLGSSVGISIIQSEAELNEHIINIRSQFDFQEALLQEYIQDAIEVSCGCLQNKAGGFTPLPPIEIIPQNTAFFDYKAKYEVGGSIEISPPQNIDTQTCKILSELTTQIHALLGCKTYSRSDFLIKGTDIFFIEINTLPGMTATSLLPQEAKAAGIDFTKLIEFIIEN